MKKLKHGLILLLISTATWTAAAPETPFRAGLRFGADMKDRLPAHSGSVDTKSPFGVTGSYQFDDTFGIEVGFTDLGRSRAQPIADAGFDLDGQIWTIGGTAAWMLNERVSALVGAGYFDLSEDGSFSGIAGSRPFNNDDSGGYLEVGLRLSVSEQLDVRGSYQHFNFDRNAEGTPWLGLEARF
jgi:predicted porin